MTTAPDADSFVMSREPLVNTWRWLGYAPHLTDHKRDFVQPHWTLRISFPYEGCWSVRLVEGRYNAEKEQEEGLLEVQFTYEIAQQIFLFVNVAGPSDVKATLKTMEFCECIQCAQTLALQLANPRIQRVNAAGVLGNSKSSTERNTM